MSAGRIPVTVVGPGGVLPPEREGVAVLRLSPGGHDHGDGAPCPACAARMDVRAVLADALEEERRGMRAGFSAVVVDARDSGDVAGIVAALEGRLPARALRDHEVARQFGLEATVGGA